MLLTRLLWSVLLVGGLVEAGLFSRSSVKEISAKSFTNKVLRNDTVTVVAFYEPWCPHCKALVPELKKSAKSLSGLVNVVAINCQREDNLDLCRREKIQSIPTIKVIRPAKKSDVDFKDVVEGKTVAHKKPRAFLYQGAREAKAINKFALSKLRNYAASLSNQESVSWLRPNKVPRVVMLPGNKYKSKSIAPLFKVLSNEYFGKIRFAYVPRRMDGAWNLLNLKAVEDSQLVYLADDKEPVVYIGSLTKSAVKKFLDEQYKLEMFRREARRQPLVPEREDAANGLEWIVEDRQDEEMEHIRMSRETFDDDQYYILLSRAKKQEELRQEQARAAGEDDTPKEIDEAAVRKEAEQLKASREAEISSLRAQASLAALGLGVNDTMTPELEAALLGEEENDFEYTGPVVGEDAEDLEPLGSEEAEIDDSDSAEENVNEDAILDEVDIDLLPEDVVVEGPEAVASYQAALKSRQNEQKGGAATAASAPKHAATPEARIKDHDWLDDVDEVVLSCLRHQKTCFLLSSHSEFSEEDKRVFLLARNMLSGSVNSKITYQYFRVDDNPGFSGMAEDFGLTLGGRDSKLHPGKTVNKPSVAVFDRARGKMAVMDGPFTSERITRFIAEVLKREKTLKEIPREYRLYVTKYDLEELNEELKNKGHDEL